MTSSAICGKRWRVEAAQITAPQQVEARCEGQHNLHRLRTLFIGSCYDLMLNHLDKYTTQLEVALWKSFDT